MSLLSLCNASCDIQRPTDTATSSGRRSHTYTTVYTGVPCSVQPRTGRIVTNGGAPAMEVDTDVFLSRVLNDIDVDWRILSGGKYYLVKSSGDMAGRGVGTAIEAKKITPQ